MDALTLTTEEVAEQLHCNRNKVTELRKNGYLKALRLGKSWIYPTADVIKFINEWKGIYGNEESNRTTD